MNSILSVFKLTLGAKALADTYQPDWKGLVGPLDAPHFDISPIEDDKQVVPNLDSEIDMIVFLSHPDEDAIHGTLRAVSDPESPYYGQFLSQDQVAEIVSHSYEEREVVHAYFRESFPNLKASHFSNTLDHLFLQTTARDIQKVFDNKLGYSGKYDEEHRGSNILLTHKTLNGDAAYDDFISHLPKDIQHLVEAIQFYLPEHVYMNDQNEYYQLIDNSICSIFDHFVRDSSFPTGSWKASVDDYDRMNPFSATVKADDDFHLFVLKGTRGLMDRGILHFVPTDHSGDIRMLPKEAGDTICKDQDALWDKYVSHDSHHIDKIELMVVQNETPTFLSFPFSREFIHADCHNRCEINSVSGICIMFQLKFTLKPFIQTKVHARAVLSDGTTSEWSAGKGNEQSFAANVIVDIPKLRDLYKVEHFQQRPTTPDDMIIVTSFLEEQFDPADAKMFLEGQGLSTADFEERLFIVGPNNPNEGKMTGIEASLDVQIIMSMAPHYGVIYWNVPGRELTPDSEPFLRLMYQLSTWNPTSKPLPSIMSISYGDEEFKGLGRHLNRLDREMAKLGMMGVTVVAASGDDGANGMKSRQMDDPHRCSFSSPGFPSTLPSVTSVGATQLSTRITPMCYHGHVTLPPMGPIECDKIGEITAQTDMGGSLITSGGGFSYYFTRDIERLWYQKKAVDKYRDQVQSSTDRFPESFTNLNGRGFPDIAVMGTNVPIVLGQKWAFLSGTSISAPVAGGLMANLRKAVSERLGRDVNLGFINPMLYELHLNHPHSFNDVIIGKNNCGYRAMECCKHGFEATVGWDPASGLGSLNIADMADHFIETVLEYQKLSYRQEDLNSYITAQE